MKPVLFLDPIIKKFFTSSNDDIFTQVQALSGEIYRDIKGRQTKRVCINDEFYFIKFHQGVGWAEIIKNWLQFKTPIIGAQNEYLAINKLHQLGIDTMTVVGFGQKGYNPAKQQSFLITKELKNTVSLEDFTIPPSNFIYKRQLIHQLAKITYLMHHHGMNHQDLYLCHFLIRPTIDNTTCYVIDLHRAKIKKKISLRYRIKDLAALYYSSHDMDLTRSDIFRFIHTYTKQSPSYTIKKNKWLWLAVKKKATRIYWKDFKKPAKYKL